VTFSVIQSASVVVVCCSVLQCVAVCCSVSQHVAVWFSVLQSAALCCSVFQCDTEQNRATRPELLKEFLCRSGSPSSNCADSSVVPAYMCVGLICTAIHRITCNILQHTTTHCIIQLCRFERRACIYVCVLNLYCNTPHHLQHTATHYNTLHHPTVQIRASCPHACVCA